MIWHSLSYSLPVKAVKLSIASIVHICTCFISERCYYWWCQYLCAEPCQLRAKNSRSHGYLYDMLSMIFWFVWGEDTGVVTRLDIYHLAAAAGSWWYWHCDCDQDQDQEDHYYWDFVNTSSSSEIAPQMTPAGPIRYTQHHTWPVLTIHGYWLYACFRSILPIYYTAG